MLEASLDSLKVPAPPEPEEPPKKLPEPPEPDWDLEPLDSSNVMFTSGVEVEPFSVYSELDRADSPWPNIPLTALEVLDTANPPARLVPKLALNWLSNSNLAEVPPAV